MYLSSRSMFWHVTLSRSVCSLAFSLSATKVVSRLAVRSVGYSNVALAQVAYMVLVALEGHKCLLGKTQRLREYDHDYDGLTGDNRIVGDWKTNALVYGIFGLDAIRFVFGFSL